MMRLAWVVLALLGTAMGQDKTIPVGAPVLRQAEGRGVQTYRCEGAGAAAAWVFVAPEARLFAVGRGSAGPGEVLGVHGAGPTWTWRDGSRVKGMVVEKVASPEAESVPLAAAAG